MYKRQARKYSVDHYGKDRTTVITLVNSFHGRTIATLTATGQDAMHKDFQPLLPGFLYTPANDCEALRKLVSEHDDIAAFMFELVQGEGGVMPLEPNFVDCMAELAKEKDILLVCDEVQTGNGRTGSLYAWMQYGFMPDIMTTAKGLGGGLPIGACLFGEKTENVLTPGTHGSTFGGNPVCAAAALYVQDRLTDELMAEVAQKGEWVRAELTQLPGVTVSGRGLMLGVESGKPASALVSDLLARGVVTLTAKTKLRLLPPLTIPWPDLKQAVSIIKEALSA